MGKPAAVYSRHDNETVAQSARPARSFRCWLAQSTIDGTANKRAPSRAL